jgi:hypothetical protein
MSAPSATLSPISNANDWMYALIAGIPTPGTIPARGGFKGFKRETGWDVKKGKGTQGAYLTLTTLPPAEGTITFQLLTDADFAQWDALVTGALSISPAKQKANGLTIYHPRFASIGLVAVVVKDYEPPDHVGKGLYLASVELIEWSKPPAVSIVSSVVKTTLPTVTITGEDPEVARLQAQIEQASAGAAP